MDFGRSDVLSEELFGFSGRSANASRRSDVRDVRLGSDSNAILSRLALMQLTSPYGSPDYWTLFRDMNSTIVSAQTKSAELQRDAAKANASNAYVTALTTNYDAETRAALDDAATRLTDDLNAEAALGAALRNAQGTSYTGLTAIRNADLTSNVLSYLNANATSSTTYASSIASAYGDFQIANRQNKLNGTTLSNPRREAYAADVTWAQQTKSLRNQYYAKSGTAASGYYATVTNALATYDAAALNAELTAAQDYFNAEKTFSQNAQTAHNDYVLADFNAAQAQALAYLTASISQLKGNYAKESELAESRADAYAELLDDLLADLAAADLTKFGTISTLKENFAEALSNANAADATIAAVNEAELASEKTENEAAYNDATAEADATYQKAQQGVWNDAFLETLGETADEKTDFDAITAAMKAALETAENAYRDESFSAYDDFFGETLDLAKIYAYNQERINNGGTVPGNAFENPTLDYEVCFVAGTQVLMADGSTKPIEQIRPGDQVLAADHLNPEEKPTAATVVRFFDNGEKDVVKLLFNNQATKLDANAMPQDVTQQEIVCTPNHRFYVIEKGWVHAQDLQQGDLCLSATGEKIAFLSRKNLAEKQRVYNFEVENAHTYFIGKTEPTVLVHNDCWDTLRVIGAGAGGFCVGLGRGVGNIARGVGRTVVEAGCQAVDIGGGIVTAGSMLVSDNPVVFEPWSRSLNALDQHDVSTGGYYGNFAAKILTFGVYSEVEAGVQLYNGEITVDEASEIIGSTGFLQYMSARAIKNSVQKQSAKTFVDQMSSIEAERYQKYWNDAKLKQYPGVSSWAREQVSQNGKYTYKAVSYFDEFGRLCAEEHHTTHPSTGEIHVNPHHKIKIYYSTDPFGRLSKNIPGTYNPK